MANKFLVNSLTLQMSVVRGFAFFLARGVSLGKQRQQHGPFEDPRQQQQWKLCLTSLSLSPARLADEHASHRPHPIRSQVFPPLRHLNLRWPHAHSHAQKPWKSERKKHTEEPPPAAASSSPFFGGHSDSLGPKQVHNSGGAGSGRDTSTVLPKSKRTGDDDDVVWTCERSHLQARSKIDF